MTKTRAQMNAPADMRLLARTRLQVALLAAIVGCLSLCLYVRCLCPTVYWSDSGELIASCVEPGIAHPNGSPVYTILGWLFSLAPVGSLAYRVNLLSAFAAALTVVLTFLCAHRLVRRVQPDQQWRALPLAAACAAAVALAVAPGLWQKATVANKYPLAAAVCAAMLLVSTARRPRPLLLGLLLGLGYGVHALTVCSAPLLALAVLGAPAGRRTRALGAAALGLALGLLPFAYLPLRSLADPARDWGNPQTLASFWWLVSGQEFQGLILGVSAPDVLSNIGYCATLIVSHFGWPAVLFAILGALLFPVGLLRRRAGAPLFLLPALLIVIVDVALVVTYDMMNDRYTWEAYLLPSYVAIACLATAGLCGIGSLKARLWRPVAWIGVAAMLIVAGHAAHRQYPLADRSRLTAARDHAMDIVRQVPQGAVLVHNASEIGFLLIYLDEVEHTYTRIINVYLPLLAYDWYGAQLKARYPRLSVPPASLRAPAQFVTENSHLPMYAYPGALDRHIDRASLRPVGFLYQVRNGAEASPSPPLAPEDIARDIRPHDYDTRTVGAYLSLLHDLALYWFQEGDSACAEDWLRQAINVGRTCRARDDGGVRQMTSLCHLSLAMALAASKRWRESEQELAQARFLHSGRLRAEREVRWGLARARQGDGPGALQHIRRALRHDPQNAVARRIMGELEADH